MTGMGLCVPAVFFQGYVEALAELNEAAGTETPIVEVYGASHHGVVGSLRRKVPAVDHDQLRRYVASVHGRGMIFNYLLNASSLDGSEHTSDGRKALAAFIETLLECGVRRITAAVPFVVRFIREHFPAVEVVASIVAGIQSAPLAERFADIGVCRIVMLQDVNRRLDIVESLSGLGVGIELLVNSPCLRACPDRNYHANLTTLETTTALSGAYRKPPDQLATCLIGCRLTRLSAPAELLRTPWIRPEDLSLYRGAGVAYFKLDGRSSPADYNLHRIEAYARGRYQGNLMYLLMENVPLLKDQLRTVPASHYPMYVENRSLDGFVVNMPCMRREMSCRRCSYCSGAAAAHVLIDKERIEALLCELSTEIIAAHAG